MKQQRGFTLIELIITVTIAAIVLAIGVPSFQGMMRNNRAAAHTNEFMSALNLARSEAIKRGQRVVLCPGNQAGCAAAWGGNDWIVFVDTDNQGDLDGGELILRTYALDGNDTVQNITLLDDFISFAADGTTRRIDNSFQAGRLRFTLCDAQDQQNNIVINPVGRVRVEKVSCP